MLTPLADSFFCCLFEISKFYQFTERAAGVVSIRGDFFFLQSMTDAPVSAGFIWGWPGVSGCLLRGWRDANESFRLEPFESSLLLFFYHSHQEWNPPFFCYKLVPHGHIHYDSFHRTGLRTTQTRRAKEDVKRRDTESKRRKTHRLSWTLADQLLAGHWRAEPAESVDWTPCCSTWKEDFESLCLESCDCTWQTFIPLPCK